MPASNNQARTFHYVLVAVWLGFTLMTAIYFIQLRLVDFDPGKRLLSVSVSDAQAEFSQSLPTLSFGDKGTLIHFSSSHCRCNKLAQRHKSTINQLASEQGVEIVDYDLGSLPGNLPVPSVPAIALFDKRGDLAYLGPYSQGIGCGESEGMIEVVMNNLRHGMNPALIYAEAKGCYCNV